MAKIRREEVYHRMHASAWLRRLADDTGEARARLEVAWYALLPDAATVFTPLPGEDRLVDAGVVAATNEVLEVRWRQAIGGTCRELGLAVPGPAVDSANSRTSHGDAIRWLWDQATMVRRLDPRRTGDGAHRRLSRRRRAGGRRRSGGGARGGVWPRWEVPDPELRLVSVVDLGLIGRVSVARRAWASSCADLRRVSALKVMRAAIAERLAGLATVVEVEAVFDPPWTSDRISAEGRRRLRTMGVAPPGTGGASLISLDAPVACPHCGSSRTRLGMRSAPLSAGRSATVPIAASRSRPSSRSERRPPVQRRLD